MRPRARLGALSLSLGALAVLGLFLARGGVVPHEDTWSLAADAFFDDRPRAAERLAREALAQRPLDGRAHAVLARVARQRGDEAAARGHVATALRHAPRHAPAQWLAAELAVDNGQWPDAVAGYDALLRVHPHYADQALPVLVTAAAQPAARQALLQVLGQHPGWRDRFLRQLANEAAEPVLVQALFDALAQRPGGLQPPEVASYLGRYLRDGDVPGAYAAWLRLRGASAPTGGATEAVPFNGGFEPVAPLGGPFEWQLDAVMGVEAGLRISPQGEGHHLRLDFAGRRAAYRGVRQLLVLPPGHWTLGWESRYESLETLQGLRWVLRCLGSNIELLATVPRRGSMDWRGEQASFSVPAEGCSAQWLQLELYSRIPAETLARGTAWFDNVSVTAAP